MKLITLTLTLIAAQVDAACIIYGGGGIQPTTVIVGNDNAEAVSDYLGFKVVELERNESGDYDDQVPLGAVAAAKAANAFALFDLVDDDCADFEPWSKHDLSHVTFYGVEAIPETSRAGLTLAGLFALIFHRRRPKKRKKRRIGVYL